MWFAVEMRFVVERCEESVSYTHPLYIPVRLRGLESTGIWDEVIGGHRGAGKRSRRYSENAGSWRFGKCRLRSRRRMERWWG